MACDIMLFFQQMNKLNAKVIFFSQFSDFYLFILFLQKHKQKQSEMK